MAKSVRRVALVLAAIASICQASFCPNSADGYCKGVTKGTAAESSGVALPDGVGIAVMKDAAAPSNGLFMSGCSLVASGAAAPSAGKFWASTSQVTPTTIASGDKAASAGVFCPDSGATCSSITSGSKAGANGVFVPDVPAINIASGAVAPSDGMFCPKCEIVASGAAAPGAGKFWTGYSATPSTVASGDTASAAGMYCPDSASTNYASTASTGTGGGSAANTTAANTTGGSAKKGTTSSAITMTQSLATALLGLVGISVYTF